MRASSCVWQGWLVLLALGCGASKSNATVSAPGQGSGGAASAMGLAPHAGEPCQQGVCSQGLSCEHSGIFTGLCTASCSSDQACGLLSARARCFGTTNQECGVACGIDADCPTGTRCVALGPVGSQRACQLAH